MATSDPDFAQAAQDFKRGGWITGVLGMAGMLARMLLTDESYPWVVWVRKGIAGGIVGVISYFAMHGTDIPAIYKSVIGSTAGVFGAEWIELGRRKLNGHGKKKRKK